MMFELALFGVNSIVSFLLGTALLLVTLFLILLILVQRGKGGGLAGALGGMGGESALGTRAGDVFTKITVGTALLWILLCMLTYKIYEPPKLSEPEDPRGSVSGTGDATGASTTPDGTATGGSGDNAPISNPATDSPFDGLGEGTTDSTPETSATDDTEASPESGSSDSTSNTAEPPESNSGEETSDQ